MEAIGPGAIRGLKDFLGNENFQVSDGRVQEVLGFVVDAIYTSLVLKGAIFRLGMGSGVELGEVADDIDFNVIM